MKKIIFLIFCYFLWAEKSSIAQSPFISGNLVVVRAGDGISTFTNLSAPLYLDEYSPSGILVQSVSLPVADNGSNKKIVTSYNQSQEGAVTISPDGRFICLLGYNAIPGISLNFLAIPSTERIISRIDYNGIINTSTGISGGDGSLPVSAITNTGNEFWANSTANGIQYTTLGQSTFTQIVSTTGVRGFNIDNNQLYTGSSTGRVIRVSGGLPTSGPQTLTVLPGMASAGGFCQAFFADLDPTIPGADVIYIAHEGTNALRKYSLVSGTWVSNGIIGVAEDTYRGITGVINGTSVTIYATRKAGTGGTSGGELVKLTDNSGYNGAFTGTPIVIASAPANTVFRGVITAPRPLSVSLSTKLFLNGAYNSGLGRHKNVTSTWANVLNTSALNQPYNIAPFNYAGTESVSAGFFTADDGVDTDILDWVLVELHDATIPSTIIASKACFIREDGKIVDLDKVSNPTFTGVGANNYYVVIKHRNHLPIRSATSVLVSGATPITYDFTTAQSQAYQDPAFPGNTAMKDVSGTFCMWGGNVNANTQVKYTGPQNDALSLLALLGANQAAILSNVYSGGDVNMDGTVRYTGPNNDALALLAVLSANQAAVINQHQ